MPPTQPSEKKGTYSDRLRDPRWQKRRLQVFNVANFACEECGATTKELHVHHLYYIPGRMPWEYPDVLLKCLCLDCHTLRGQLEQEVFINVATVLRDKSADEIRSLPIYAFFTDCQPLPR